MIFSGFLLKFSGIFGFLKIFVSIFTNFRIIDGIFLKDLYEFSRFFGFFEDLCWNFHEFWGFLTKFLTIPKDRCEFSRFFRFLKTCAEIFTNFQDFRWFFQDFLGFFRFLNISAKMFTNFHESSGFSIIFFQDSWRFLRIVMNFWTFVVEVVVFDCYQRAN